MEPTQKPSSSRRFWRVIIIAGLATPVLLLLCYRYGPCADDLPGDLKALLAEYHNVPDSTLYLNIPPGLSRYPGTILLKPYNIHLAAVASDNPNLIPGPDFRYASEFARGVRARSTLVGGVVETMISSEAAKKLTIEVDPGRTIEADAEFLSGYLRSSSLLPTLSDSAIANMIYRAFEGRVTIRAEYTDALSATAWANKKDELLAKAGTLSVSFDTGGRRMCELSFDAVYAFVAIDAKKLANDLGIELVGAPQGPFDTTLAVRNLLALDPAELPNIEGTLEEIGSGAGREIIIQMQSGGPVTRDRGQRVLMRLPPESRTRFADPETALGSTDAATRGLAVLQIAESPSPNTTTLLGQSLRDNDGTVRLLAATSITTLGPTAAEVRPALETAAAQDPDPDVRIAAQQALYMLPTQQLSTVENALQSGDTAAQVAALRATGVRAEDEPTTAIRIFSRGLTADDSQVKLEALRAIAGSTLVNDSIIEMIGGLRTDSDPEVRKLAESVSRRVAARP